MENYQNAGAGLKKMFIASVGTVACTVLAIIPLVNIIAAIGVLVFGVISLVGLYGAGKDIEGCKKAFTLTIANLVVSIVGSFFKSGFLAAIVSIAGYVLSFMVVYLVCTSVPEVMNQVGAADVAQKGETVWKINAGCYGVLAVVAIAGLIPVLSLIAAAAAGIVAIVSLVALVLYMIFLNKSSKALGA